MSILVGLLLFLVGLVLALIVNFASCGKNSVAFIMYTWAFAERQGSKSTIFISLLQSTVITTIRLASSPGNGMVFPMWIFVHRRLLLRVIHHSPEPFSLALLEILELRRYLVFRCQADWICSTVKNVVNLIYTKVGLLVDVGINAVLIVRFSHLLHHVCCSLLSSFYKPSFVDDWILGTVW